MKKMDMKIDCKTCRTSLADLLLDESYVAAHPEVTAHMAACAECRKETGGAAGDVCVAGQLDCS